MEVVGDLCTWDEFSAYIERTYEGKRNGHNFIRATCRTRDDKEMFIGTFLSTTHSGKPWVVMAIKLGPRDDVRPRPALIANSDLPIGALAVLRDQLIVRQSLPLGGLAPSLVDRTLRTLVGLAVEVIAAKGEVGADDDNDDDYVDSPYAYIYR